MLVEYLLAGSVPEYAAKRSSPRVGNFHGGPFFFKHRQVLYGTDLNVIFVEAQIVHEELSHVAHEIVISVLRTAVDLDRRSRGPCRRVTRYWRIAARCHERAFEVDLRHYILTALDRKIIQDAVTDDTRRHPLTPNFGF